LFTECGLRALTRPYVPLMGDVNHDKLVTMDDLVVALDAFGACPTHPRGNPYSDLDGDGKVDTGDIVIILMNFGKHCL
jgi:hypothetical protein